MDGGMGALGTVLCHSVTQHYGRLTDTLLGRGRGRRGRVLRVSKGNLKSRDFFSPFDCVRHFELEKLLSFTLVQIISGNITGDSEYK